MKMSLGGEFASSSIYITRGSAKLGISPHPAQSPGAGRRVPILLPPTLQQSISHRRKRSHSQSMGYIQEARENHVKKKVEEALRSKMKQKALKECDRYTSRYAQCAAGRTLSVVWKCREQAKELNNCLHQYTNDSVLEEMKKDYMLQQNNEASAGI